MDILSNLEYGGARAHLLRPLREVVDRASVVAISGGTGAGKTTLASFLRSFAGAFADADQIAREVVAPGTQGLAAIREHFGQQIIQPDGSLQRQALAQIVFSDPQARADLEAITHPLIAREARKILSQAPPGTFALYDVPLIRSTTEASIFDHVIMVSSPLERRLERLVQRGLSRDDAQRRIASQISDEERRTFATIWVDNAGDVESLNALSKMIVREWLLPGPQHCETKG